MIWINSGNCPANSDKFSNKLDSWISVTSVFSVTCEVRVADCRSDGGKAYGREE